MQKIIVHSKGSNAKIYYIVNDKEMFIVDGFVGQNGVGVTNEGNKITPVGTHKFIKAFGILDDPGCKVEYTKLDKYMRWVDDPKSKFYNKFISIKDVEPDWNSSEHLFDIGKAYNYVLALDYNTDKCTPYLGSAIFLHCIGKGPTAGCVAIPEENMKIVLQNFDWDCEIVID